jgi:hypothetical protein
VGRVCDIHWLRSKLDLWKEDTLFDVCHRLRLVDGDKDGGKNSTEFLAKRLGCTRRQFLTSILLYHHSSRPSDATILSSAPLYPTESLLWDAHSVPSSNAYHSQRGHESLCLPKLNARFLSPGDYLSVKGGEKVKCCNHKVAAAVQATMLLPIQKLPPHPLM